MEYKGKINPYHHEPKKGISWRAVFAGTVTVLSIMLVLNLIGMAIGFGSINPTEEANPMSGIGTGALIWWVISNLIALFAGGFIAARVGVSLTNTGGMVQGVMTWALYALVSAWMLTTVVGTIISGVGTAVGGVISTTGQMAGDAIAPIIEREVEDINLTLDEAKEEFYALLEEAGVDPDDLESDLQETVSRGLRDGNVERAFRNARSRLGIALAELDRESLVDVLEERTDMSRSEAQNAVDNVLAEYDAVREDVNEFLADAEEMAREQGGEVADAAAKASAYLAIALIFGVVVAAFGGFAGARALRDDYEQYYEDPGYVPGPLSQAGGYGSSEYTESDPRDPAHSTRPIHDRTNPKPKTTRGTSAGPGPITRPGPGKSPETGKTRGTGTGTGTESGTNPERSRPDTSRDRDTP